MMEMKIEGTKKSKGFDKWEVESWAKTIVEAEELKADPKKMEAIKPYLQTKIKAMDKIKSIDGLREKAKEVIENDDEYAEGES